MIQCFNQTKIDAPVGGGIKFPRSRQIDGSAASEVSALTYKVEVIKFQLLL